MIAPGTHVTERDAMLSDRYRKSQELLERGVPGIHFYTLNRSTASRSIFQKLREG